MTLRQHLPPIAGTYTEQVPLAPLTTVQVGGPAQVWAHFRDLTDFADFLRQKPEHIPLTILGEGSNMLIRDGGIPGVVTSLHFLTTVAPGESATVYAEAGATCGKAARAAREAGLTGLEFYAGIPGSVGGALRMNAGCYGADTASVLQSATVLTATGELQTLSPQELGYAYRQCALPPGWVFVSALFQLRPGDKESIRTEMRRINAERRESQPLDLPSSGSWFKNPVVAGVCTNAWKVVDQAGCRGWQEGGAQVSEKHCNFFVNRGGATAEDFERLSQRVEAAVLAKLGVVLEREVRFSGVPSTVAG